MARFLAGVTNQAPLQIQLGARVISGTSQEDVTSPLVVVEMSAFGGVATPDGGSGDQGLGQVSRPVFLRPTTPGYVTVPDMVQMGRPLASGVSSNVGWLAIFSSAPSTPLVTSGNFNLPLSVRYSMPVEHGIVVDDFLVFYAQALSGASWTAHIIWEEK